MYDVYTPIVAEASQPISFEQAKQNVLDALAVLGEDYIAILKEGFDHRWIDVYENEGKRGGAYSAGGDPHPYVLLNFKTIWTASLPWPTKWAIPFTAIIPERTSPSVRRAM